MRVDQLFGTIVRARDVSPSIQITADVAVIGMGAGGAAALAELARQGLRVVGIEAGPQLTPAQMRQREERMMPQIFAESGARTTDDLSLTLLQGQGVGGSTLHNTNLCKRIPTEVLDDWETRLGLRFPGLDDDFAFMESLLGVHPVPDDRVNANNDVLQRGIRALGYRGGRLSHNRDGACRQSGFCEVGCAYDGKRNAARVLVPTALQRGAMVLADARVDRIHQEGDKVTALSGRLIDPERHREIGDFDLQVDAVILAGSATGSAALHIASGLPDPYALAGRRLHVHPGAMVMGLHEEPIRGWEGVPQSVECTEFLSFGPQARDRVWIVSGFAHPAMAATLLPGLGEDHARWMRKYAHASAAIAMVHDHTAGYVRPGPEGTIRVHYAPDAADRAQIALGLREAARLLLAGGAREVLVPLRPLLRLTAEDDIDAAITAEKIERFSPALTAVHPMSTLWMGNDPRTSVVDSTGKHHHLSNLWVADGSLFPTSIGGPPQIGIYTFGHRVGREVASHLPR